MSPAAEVFDDSVGMSTVVGRESGHRYSSFGLGLSANKQEAGHPRALETSLPRNDLGGSMTHFYTNSIDRNVAHEAARIADSLVGDPIRRSLHIAFFVGSDLFSHLMLSKLVPSLISQGHVLFIFLPSHKVSKAAQPFNLRELSFFERQLLQEYVIPFSRSSGKQGSALLNVEQLGSSFGILVEKVKNVNEPSFLKCLQNNHIDVGISLRCYQRFRSGIIQYFNSPRIFLNLHPGILPSYRGVVPTIRAMMNGEDEFGYTLHHIDEQFDSGDILDIRTYPIDYQKAMLHNMEDVHHVGVELVLDTIEDLSYGKIRPPRQQNAAESRYYTFPTEEELEICRQKGIRLVDPVAVKSLLIRSFAPPGDEDALKHVIDDAVDQWYRTSGETRKES